MKRIYYLYIFLFLAMGSAHAQVDRTKYPEPGPAPQINIGDAETFTLPSGLKVFVVENHKLPRVTFSLVLDRDPLLEGDKAGLTSLMGGMMMGGTANRTKDQLDNEIDMIGAQLSFNSTSANASSLTKYQDKLLTLFSDVLLHPIFPQSELDKLKKQEISGIASMKDDPNAISTIVSNAVLYGKDHPYGEVETEKTVSNIQLADIKDYYARYFRPNIAYLAIVGDITKSQAETLVKQYFGTWQQQEVPKHEWPVPSTPEKNKVILVNRPASVQSIINVTYPVQLKQNSPDAIPVQLLNNILGGGSAGRLFQTLRESKGYTYGAYSTISSDKLVGSFGTDISVRTEVTDSAVHYLLEELKRIEQEPISTEELASSKAILSGSFGRSLEQPATIARFAINTERYQLSKDYYKNYLKNLNAVTVTQLHQLAPKYIKPNQAYVVIVGNTDAFKDKIGKFGEIAYYTNTGDPEVKTAVTDTNVTADKVISNYLEAIGGKEKLNGVKTFKSILEAEIQGMKIVAKLVVDQTKPIAIQTMSMGTQMISKIVVNPDKAMMSGQGQEQEAPAELFKSLKGMLKIFPELNYANDGTELALDGIVKVNDEDTYKVIVTTPEGEKITSYFSVATGLKVKMESAIGGDVEIKEYKAYNGIQLPSVTTVKNANIPVPLKLVAVNQEINPSLTAQDLQ